MKNHNFRLMMAGDGKNDAMSSPVIKMMTVDGMELLITVQNDHVNDARC